MWPARGTRGDIEQRAVWRRHPVALARFPITGLEECPVEDDLRHQLPAKARRHGQMNPRRVRVAEVMECQGGVVRDDGLRLARTVMAQQRQDDEVCTREQGI